MVAAALQAGYGIDKLYDLTKIDRWFLHKFKNIVSAYERLEKLQVCIPVFGLRGKKCLYGTFSKPCIYYTISGNYQAHIYKIC